MDRGAWQATVQGIAKSLDATNISTFHFNSHVEIESIM